MPIVLTIVNSPENILIAENTKTFGEQGGTLGRGDTNTWVLNDPDRYLSSVHCEINHHNGQYELVDLSTNGTFINNLSEPIGRGNRRILKDGDVFDLGDYVFKVSFSDVGLKASEAQFYGDPFAAQDSKNLFEYGLASETDPLIVMNKSRQTPDFELKNELFQDFSPVDILSNSIDWPNAQPENGVIPDDWDSDAGVVHRAKNTTDISAIQSADINEYKLRNQHLEDSNQKLKADLKAIKQEIKTLKENIKQRSENSDFQIDKNFVNALGLGDKELNDQQIVEINQTSGELLRESVAGMIQVLGSRNDIKNEFRMNVTTIQPIENNPLKFSANIDDALENMFIKKGKSFKKPVQAFKDGFQSIAEHQIAIMSGMRFAFKGVMDRFDPIALEKRFEKQNKAGFISSKNARNWNAYLEYYNELINDMDKSFQYLFGDDFIHAYEEQLRNLATNNKSQSHSAENVYSEEI